MLPFFCGRNLGDCAFHRRLFFFLQSSPRFRSIFGTPITTLLADPRNPPQPISFLSVFRFLSLLGQDIRIDRLFLLPAALDRLRCSIPQPNVPLNFSSFFGVTPHCFLWETEIMRLHFWSRVLHFALDYPLLPLSLLPARHQTRFAFSLSDHASNRF